MHRFFQRKGKNQGTRLCWEAPTGFLAAAIKKRGPAMLGSILLILMGAPWLLNYTLLCLQTTEFSLIFSSTKDSEDFKFKLFVCFVLFCRELANYVRQQQL